MSNAEHIHSPYPGAFYRKPFDNGKIKIFTRGTSMKLYMYPHFKPRSPKIKNRVYVGCIEQSYQFLELSNDCWGKMDTCLGNFNECQKISNDCRQISVDFFNKSNNCFKKLNDNNKS